ncbi:hypothetical protein AMS68_003243 [Peltaster fructicola]|uniref:Carrier domain-containing protein n=1 Tax=Peltaster fructicola TaxID=286661 RepID=A0A6H0XSS4_9PEZI|nr:hypothetical protein AMS68_003243 [Peltaster fructicola]
MVSQLAADQPDLMAVQAWDGRLSYRQLEEHSTSLAMLLVAKQVGKGQIVPILMEKGIWSVIAMLGVMKSGAASVLLDCSQPLQRLHTISQQVDASLVLTTSHHEQLAARLGDVQVITLSEASLTSTLSTSLPKVTPNDTVYAVATSGTTGTPKIAAITHTNLASAIYHQRQVYCFNEQTRFIDLGASAFDISWLIWHVLTVGGTVCMPSDEERRSDPARAIGTFAASATIITPSVARLISTDDVPTLQTVLLGGEALLKDDINAWGETRIVHNAYGPAECTIVTVHWSGNGKQDMDAPIGFGVGAITWVVDQSNVQTLCTIGETGELCLEGPLVGLGYVNDPVKTAASFIDSPEWIQRGSRTHRGRRGRLYRTGDLVRYGADGTLHYIGRKDNQVKIRGQRAELGEIEGAIRQLLPFKSGLRIAVELVQQPDKNRSRLVVFITMPTYEDAVSMAQDAEMATSELNRALIERLPSYMVPDSWIPLSHFPVGTTGKLDRAILRTMVPLQTIADEANTEGVHSGREAQLRDIWARILHLQPENISDKLTFTQHGGDSISNMSLIVALRKTFDVKVPVTALGRSDLTLSVLAKLLDEHEASAAKEQKTSSNFQPQTIARILRSKVRTVHSKHNQRACKVGSDVFLTGASGYLGVGILYHLLQYSTFHRLIVLVRPSKTQSGLERIKRAARLAGWWNEALSSRIIVWEGDLAKPWFDLRQQQWDVLCGRQGNVEAIVHNGAAVDWSSDYYQLKATNVESTIQLLRAAASSERLQRFVYISGGRLAMDQDTSEVVETGYDQTKQVSEHLMLLLASTANKDASKYSVIKPGLVIGGLINTVANTDDFLWRVVKCAIQLKARPDEPAESQLLISLVDQVAEQVLNQLVAAKPSAYKLAVNTLPVQLFWDAVEEQMQLPLQVTSPATWRKLVHESVTLQQETHPLWPVLHLIDEPLGNAVPTGVALGDDHKLMMAAVRANIAQLCRVGFLKTTASEASASGMVEEMWTRRKL